VVGDNSYISFYTNVNKVLRRTKEGRGDRRVEKIA
jgi:hypothetical protein